MKKALFILLALAITAGGAYKLYQKKIIKEPILTTFSTHVPVLKKAVLSTDGPIIEFGSGEASTVLLHRLCKKKKRLLITLEDNEKWANYYKEKYRGDGYKDDNTGWHRIYHVAGRGEDQESPKHWLDFLASHPELLAIEYDICFIDQSPWLARFEALKQFKNISRYILIHDVDYLAQYNIFGKELLPIDRKNSIPGKYDFSDQLKYFHVYFPKKPWPEVTGPPTLIGSNFTDSLPIPQE